MSPFLLPTLKTTNGLAHNHLPYYHLNKQLKYATGVIAAALLLSTTSCTQDKEVHSATIPVSTERYEQAVVKDSVSPLPADTVAANVASAPASATPADEYPGPAPLPGAILPHKRILAYYGNPLSKRMGILGEFPAEEMLNRLDEEVANWTKADSLIPVQPALHAIVVTAQGHPGRGAKYRLRMTDKMIEDVLAMAKQRDAIVFLDVQVGRSTLPEELPRLTQFLKLPNVHLGIDAEFAMKENGIPGRSIGSFDAKDINYATEMLADITKEHNLPPKLLIVHRFTQRMITNHQEIKLRPEVQVVMHMDGWGSPALKKDTYRRFIAKEPVQYTGFKVFYKNDTRNNSRLMTPEEILTLTPKPLYIQYQ
ncbi:hypothetical protein H9Q13_01890 [Pontibacter sp. JH31]|uniref:Lipoprotein n=1 Tax=Pontibacter aquaedesilientis TaxID=2766980 RepID=A0ABR7XC69_9BACT|nr:hypothetical protein [Pontibacter aquaedesilientis]MBD1395902.1 hypothetical protein [Pontibacter aquaedesilientis]